MSKAGRQCEIKPCQLEMHAKQTERFEVRSSMGFPDLSCAPLQPLQEYLNAISGAPAYQIMIFYDALLCYTAGKLDYIHHVASGWTLGARTLYRYANNLKGGPRQGLGFKARSCLSVRDALEMGTGMLEREWCSVVHGRLCSPELCLRRS